MQKVKRNRKNGEAGGVSYKEAEEYAEALVYARAAIVRAVRDAKAERLAERRDFFDRWTRGTGTTAAEHLQPLAVVRCISRGQSFLIEKPELWLKVINDAFPLYRQRFCKRNEDAYTTIEHRFKNLWSIDKILSAEQITRRTYHWRRMYFLHGLVVLAVQAGLLCVSSEEPPDEYD